MPHPSKRTIGFFKRCLQIRNEKKRLNEPEQDEKQLSRIVDFYGVMEPMVDIFRDIQRMVLSGTGTHHFGCVFLEGKQSYEKPDCWSESNG